MKTLAIANHKGGTGKTALALHLSVGLARQGRRVLLVDMDPQQNASRWALRVPHALGADVPGVAQVLESGRIDGPELHSSPLAESLSVLPSTKALLMAEMSIATKPAGQVHLRRALERVRRNYEFAVIDCAPSLGTGTVTALCAADYVFVPIFPQYLSLVGVGELEATIKRLREGFRVRTYVGGYVLFGVDEREGLAEDTRQVLRTQAKEKLLRSEVRVSTAGKKLPDVQMTAWDAGADARGREDYRRVLDEVLRRVAR